jgi:hypothetical protein
MYVNAKMIPVETILGTRERGVVKESDGGGEFKYDIFDNYKNFCKCHNTPSPSTIKKEKISKIKCKVINK